MAVYSFPIAPLSNHAPRCLPDDPQPFKSVSAAIGSHPGHIAVTLELQQCERTQQQQPKIDKP